VDKLAIEELRRDARSIWRAGVDAVLADRLIGEAVSVEGGLLRLSSEVVPLDEFDRIVVVGGGKAAAGMAVGFENALGAALAEKKQLSGWLNVPDDCVVPLPLGRIHLHGARPPGQNEPTERAAEGTARILQMARSLADRDLCVCLLSGGGSALLPAPVEGITLADKLAVTQLLSAGGANIEQLNTVRKQLSRFKGGGLARACRAGRLVTLMISDVMGDPLDVIGSGPTVEDSSRPEDAMAILERFGASEAGIDQRVFATLRQAATRQTEPFPEHVRNLIIGNNATAVDAAGRMAVKLGYNYVLESATASEGTAEEVARTIVRKARQLRDTPGPNCLVSGGEPVVELAPKAMRGRGGRNQQFVLAALAELGDDLKDMVILSGGTDGEDGPTDAAGGFVDELVWGEATRRGLDVEDFLRRNDAYNFLEPLDALIKTGATHTNVGDLRVVLVRQRPNVH